MEQTLSTDTMTNVVDPLVELGLATAILIPVIIIHGWCLAQTSKFFSTRFARYTAATPHWRVGLLTSATIALLVAIHLMETLVWTAPLIQLEILKNFRDAYYYVLQSYTTLGEGDVILPDNWRLIGPVIAISGLFTFGWTASVLVVIMTETGKLYAARSKAAARDAERDGGERDRA
jgi:hypothetical protein